MRRPLCMVTSLEGRLPWSRCLGELHPIAVRILYHADHRPETHLRPRPHDLLMLYRIVYALEIRDHLRSLTARQRSTVFDAINQQLTYEPTVETRNRKPLRPNPLASWELRIGDLRVYDDAEEDPEQQVNIVAIGMKHRNRVSIGGELYDI